MVEVETVLQAVPALGVMVALLYYSYTIRNTEKMRRKDIIFQSGSLVLRPEYFEAYYLTSDMWDYETLDEYLKKFSRDQRTRLDWVLSIFNIMGIAYKNGVAAEDELFQLFPPNFVINIFEMSWPYIRGLREAYKNPALFMPLEELYTESRRMNPGYIPMWQKGLRSTRVVHP
jgi:hypothetical protein